METSIAAVGWQADWLNGWLAAIGCLVVHDGLKLSWSKDSRPHAVFRVDDSLAQNVEELAVVISKAMPTLEDVVRRLEPLFLKQEPELSLYQEQCGELRRQGDWLVSSLITDCGPPKDPIDKSMFYPGAQKGLQIQARLMAMKEYWENPAAIGASMLGRSQRIDKMGLAFDSRRMLDATHPGNVQVDPGVEILAYFGMLLFPVRGDGRSVWTRRAKRGALTWPVWSEPLDLCAVDSVLQPNVAEPTYEVVRYKKRGNDASAAYFSKRVEEQPLRTTAATKHAKRRS